MRISHTELDLCARNPTLWYASRKATNSHPFRMGYDRALRLAIFHLHNTSSETAGRARLAELISKHQFRDAGRVSEIENSLEDYIEWSSTEKLKVAGVQVRIAARWGFLELRGELGRLDVTADGYRAVIFSEVPENWRSQLRMPLIQAAVGIRAGRPTDEVHVGFQRLDGSGLETECYSNRDLANAQQRFCNLGVVLKKMSAQKS